MTPYHFAGKSQYFAAQLLAKCEALNKDITTDVEMIRSVYNDIVAHTSEETKNRLARLQLATTRVLGCIHEIETEEKKELVMTA